MTKLLRLLTLIFVLTTLNVAAQHPQKPNASEIYQDIKKLNFLGSVLYLAAHPDDENTRLISYFSNNIHARTGYLSLTRGDGGQNLIGPEIRELLGVIRTQELLTARAIDGGEQRFTRANDFGYSKHPDETLDIWNKNEVLSDVVLAIRQFKPDVIINRFDHRSPGRTHGHHTTSAMLSIEAFDIANNPEKYPKHLDITSTWQPKRVFFNTSWWFYGSQEKFDKADKSEMLSIDIGTYYPELGLSNSEIASLSRSQHKSQGFGNTGTRGKQMEYIELIKGDMPSTNNVFEGIDTSWNRVKGGKTIGAILKQVEDDFDFTNPSASVPKLIEAYKHIQNLEDAHWKALKTKEIKHIIAACSGLYLEAVANTNLATAGETIDLNIETINRSQNAITLVSYNTENHQVSKNINLTNNTSFQFEEKLNIPKNQAPTTPYWLTQKGSLGMYKVDDINVTGNPETPRVFNVTFNLYIENTPISFTKPVVYKYNDPVKGEVYKPFEIVPVVSAKIDEKVIIFNTNEEKEIPVIIKAEKDNLEGFVQIAHPKDWQVYPKKQNISLSHKGEEQTVTFTVVPPKYQSEGFISPMVNIDDTFYTKELIEIDYNHIPFQTVLLPSESKVVKLDIKKIGENIAYIEGAGDVVPESLQQIGYNVVTLAPEDISLENLSSFDAVVIGIRAYNTVEELKFKQQALFNFVKQGGNMIVQYNTSHRLKTQQLAPYKLELSRDRVTDEFAKVTLLKPEHPILNYPNNITQNDFEGWTQERGLYFPNKWDKHFTPILSMHDKGESAKKGSLLVTQYGKGYYIYTGLSFFREFPAGVSGAYRLFANMLSLGKEANNNTQTLND
ncbi:PIG-L family deacetylase [Mangrovimonas cancribranchiae]|uniref:PIG-L family deacetylase n=1 Tax=Mangrovimonas cancribranchiae TaxID=3080055 RepID=A0AAU6P0P8_9FLAO